MANSSTKSIDMCDLIKEWAQRLMRRMGFVKHKAFTGGTVDLEVSKNLQTKFLNDIQTS